MSSLSAAARSTATLAVLAALTVLAAVYGWSAVSDSFGSEDTVDTSCSSVGVEVGDRVSPDMVEVSVLNAGSTEGLAGEVLGDLVDQGFLEGSTANAPTDTEVARAQIWASDQRDPAVLLLKSRIPGAVPVVDNPVSLPGVVLVVGNGFPGLQGGRDQVVAKRSTTLCVS